MTYLQALAAIPRGSWRIVARIPFGAKRRCCICERSVQWFLPYRGGLAGVPPLIRQLGVVGSDVENFECPACGCHDRERHLLMYLRSTDLLRLMVGAKILHIAPEQHLQRFIRDTAPAEYVLGDLSPTRTGVQRIDLQAVPYPANYFDFVLANHVLEHVHDDMQALREIFRILRPGGYAVLQTPYSSVLTHVFEDPGIETETACLHAYGQQDHCRLYGRDIVERFETAGFRPLVANHSELLSEIDSVQLGVNPDEPFFLFKKDLAI
jgi:SAM-dependent methyltransferase